MIHRCVEANGSIYLLSDSNQAIRFEFCHVGHEPASTGNGQFNMETLRAGWQGWKNDSRGGGD